MDSGYDRKGVEVFGTSRSFGYGHGSVTELRSSGYFGAVVQNSQKFRAGTKKKLYPYPWYCGTGRTQLTEVSGTGMNVLQNSQKFRVRV